jgi:predicted permease
MISDLKFRLRALFRRAAVERELDDELRFHLEHEIAKHVAAGMPRNEAERRARLSFGGVDRIKDDTRVARGVNVIETLCQDLRYAWRGIVAKPGFAAAVITALALGIGANTAMFGIVDRLLFRPPAYLMNADRVHRVYFMWSAVSGDRTDRWTQYARYTDLTRWTSSFDRTAILAYRTVAVGDGVDARDMLVAAASSTLFGLFDARPAIGRFFTDDEDRPPAGEPVCVLGYAFWRSHYGERRDVLGTKLHVGELVVTIIGVAPQGFVGVTDDRAPIAFLPATFVAASRSPDYYRAYHWSWAEMFARRKPGVSIAAADADLTAAYRRSWEAERVIEPRLASLDRARPHAIAGSIHLSRGPEATPDSKVVTWVMGVAVIVLLVACANVANLLLARAVSRRREIALRVALGVSRARLVQQLSTETILLASLGGVSGLLIAFWGGKFLRAMFREDDSAGAVVTDGRTIGFVAVATLAVALLTGLAPALHAVRGDVNAALKAGSRDSAYRRSRVATALLLFQGALCVVLLVGAGLFVRSVSNVRAMRLGYDVEPLLYAEGLMRGVKLTSAEQNALDDRMLEAAETTPGVNAATLAISVPFWSSEGRGTPIVAGKDSLAKLGDFLLQGGSPSYFKTVGTRILRGRGFLQTDRENTARVAVISQSMADGVWPGENPLGKQFRLNNDTRPFITVVGISENVRGRHLTGANEMWYYLPIAQYVKYWPSYPALFARVNGRPEDAVDMLRRRLQSLMPGESYVNVTPLKTMVAPQQRAWEFGATMFIAFGGLALLLAAIGLYSVIAYAVAQRTRELGVRIALGASSGDVIRMIVGQGVTFALAGIAIGSVIALASSRWVEPMLFAQSAKDPTVFVAVGAVLLVVAVVASARPAIRAMRVDPSEVLRSD